jgi:hypothetical protein
MAAERVGKHVDSWIAEALVQAAREKTPVNFVP